MVQVLAPPRKGGPTVKVCNAERGRKGCIKEAAKVARLVGHKVVVWKRTRFRAVQPATKASEKEAGRSRKEAVFHSRTIKIVLAWALYVDGHLGKPTPWLPRAAPRRATRLNRAPADAHMKRKINLKLCILQK